MSAQLQLLTECRMPKRGTHCYIVLMAMINGERLTIWTAMQKHRVGALSQRIGNLKYIFGWERVIKSRPVETDGGATVSEYWIEPCDVPQK